MLSVAWCTAEEVMALEFVGGGQSYRDFALLCILSKVGSRKSY